MEDPYVDEDSYMSEDPFLEDSRGEASCKLGDVFILPDDAEIHNTRIILQNAEISCAGDDRMVESFQQHNRFKIRILRTCPAIDAFLDKLLPYGSDEPHRKFNKTTMELSSWKITRDNIQVADIPEELTSLAIKIASDEPQSRFANQLPITSSIPLLAFASAPKLAENCHELKGNLAGLTLKPSADLIKRDHEARKDLLSILKTYLGLSTSAILLSSINHISDVKKHPPPSAILSERNSGSSRFKVSNQLQSD